MHENEDDLDLMERYASDLEAEMDKARRQVAELKTEEANLRGRLANSFERELVLSAERDRLRSAIEAALPAILDAGVRARLQEALAQE